MPLETRRFSKLKSPQSPNDRCLIVVAAPAEAKAVLAGFGMERTAPDAWNHVVLAVGYSLLLCGVGKANASGATARAIAEVAPMRVLNLGICGALPHPHPLSVGQAVLASRCVFADEGIETPDGWVTLKDAGFPAGIDSDSITPTEQFNRQLTALADRAGTIGTVSACSGTDSRAAEIARRCGPDALAEAMEGAAIGLAARRAGIAFAELRVVSNRTGNRASQGWNLPAALARLESLASRLIELSSRA